MQFHATANPSRSPSGMGPLASLLRNGIPFMLRRPVLFAGGLGLLSLSLLMAILTPASIESAGGGASTLPLDPKSRAIASAALATGAGSLLGLAWLQPRRGRSLFDADGHLASEFSARLIESVRDYAIYSLDANGRVMSWNEGARRIKGFTADEAIGKHVSTFYPAEDLLRGIPWLFMLTALREGRAECEGQRVRKDGTMFWAHVTLTPVYNTDGHLEGFSKITRDVTELRRSQERLRLTAAELQVARRDAEAKAVMLSERNAELEQARNAADSASRAKSSFLSNMAHEIRTPLTAILGYSELISDPDLPPEQLREHLVAITRSGHHLFELVNDLLDVSKIESGAMRLELLQCSPAQLARDVVSVLVPRAQSKGLTIELSAESKLPALCRTDPTKLRQILVNLLGNAIKFTESGSIKLVVDFTADAAKPSEGTLTMAVTDTGLGIAPEVLPTLFKPFTQADASTTRRFGGTGLGLSICRSFAELLGGSLAVRSQLNVGSTFTVSLHVTDASSLIDLNDAPATTVSATQVGSKPIQPLAGRRILVAEDGPDNQRLISHILTKGGATVTMTGDGQAALDAHGAAVRPFDLVILDLQMPRLDGYSAGAALRDLGFRGPMLALSAHAMVEEAERCRVSGFDRFMGKPFERASLLSACTQLLAGERGIPLARTSPPPARPGEAATLKAA